MTEQWRYIPGFENYSVSDCGRIRNADRDLKTPIDCVGYPQVNLRKDGETHHFRVHTLMLISFKGPPQSDQVTRHLDGNRSNNVLSNLRWGTEKENYFDAVRHGTAAKGERHGKAKLTAVEVLAIRRLIAIGITQKGIAAQYGVSRSRISNIKHHVNWKSLK